MKNYDSEEVFGFVKVDQGGRFDDFDSYYEKQLDSKKVFKS